MSSGRLPLDGKYRTLIGRLLVRVNVRTEFRRVQPGLNLIQIKGVCTQKDGDVHDKFKFLEIQELRPLKTCQKHFETIFPNFLLDEYGI